MPATCFHRPYLVWPRAFRGFCKIPGTGRNPVAMHGVLESLSWLVFPSNNNINNTIYNWIRVVLIRKKLGAHPHYSDLHPESRFRKNVEFSKIEILRKKMSYIEVPVRYKRRIGVSKVSGTVKGTIFAGIKILGWIFKYSFK